MKTIQDKDGGEAKQIRETLQNAPVRLGTSYLLIFTAYQPSAKPNEADERSALEVHQIYYDYGDRLGVALSGE